MQYPYLKNIDHEQVLSLTNLVSIQDGQVVSKTLAQNNAISITVFAFSKGEEISSHESSGDAMITILEGTSKIIIDGKAFILQEGETIVMPAQKPHAVYAQEDFKMLLVVVFANE